MADKEESSAQVANKKMVGAKQGVDVNQGTKRRVEQAVSIRHKNRLEQLTKRRKEDDSDDNDELTRRFGGGQDENGADLQDDDFIRQTNAMFSRIADFCGMMDPNNSPDIIAEGVWSIRRLLCHPERSPLADLTRHGGIEKLITLLDAPDPNIQYNAAWSLTNISSGATSYAHIIIRCGAIPKFIRFLESPTEKLREQAAWCLGNMAGDGASIRDEILAAGVMDPLLKCLNGENENVATLRNAVWLLAQLCRNKPSPAFDLVECCLPTVKRLLQHPVAEVQDDACWAVSYLADGPPNRINAVMSYGVMPLVMELLRSGRETVMLPSVRTFGNFTATNPEMTQIIIDQGVLRFLAPLLEQSVSRQIRKEVCWLISNACAGTDEQVIAVMDSQLFQPVIRNIYALEFEVRREAVWVVANATATASVDRIRYLTENCNVLDGLCNVLSTMDSRICNIALESIEAILLVGDGFRDANGGINPYAERIEQIGGRENIARLRDHICHTVFLRSATLMERYFENEWNGNDYVEDEVEESSSSNNQQPMVLRDAHGRPLQSTPHGTRIVNPQPTQSPGGAPAPGSSHIPPPPNQAQVVPVRGSAGGAGPFNSAAGGNQQPQHRDANSGAAGGGQWNF